MKTVSTEWIPIERIRESPLNPRKHYDQAKLEELAQSVKASEGNLQAGLAREVSPIDRGLELVYGHRRFRALKLAGLTHMKLEICKLSDEDALDLMLAENMARADLTPVEEADGLKQRLDQGATVAELALCVGRTENFIRGRLKLADMPEPVRVGLVAGELKLGHAQLIAALGRATDQEKALAYALDGDKWRGKPTVGALAQWIEQKCALKLAEAAWALDDALLHMEAGACSACPKRSEQTSDLFPGVSKEDLCLDPGCWAGKIKAFEEREADQGRQVLKIATGFAAPKGAIPNQCWTEIGREPESWQLIGVREDLGLKPDAKISRKKLEKAFPELKTCKHVTAAKVVAGGRKGAIIRVCAETSCKVHQNESVHKPKPAPKAEEGTPAKQQGTWEEEREAKKRKAERECAVRERVLEALLAKLKARALPLEDLKLAVADVLHFGDFDCLMKRHGWESSSDVEGNARQLTLLLFESMFEDEVNVTPWGASQKPKKLLEAAKRHGVDAACIRKQVLKELKDAAKADKPKPKKKARKTKKKTKAS